MKYSILLLLLPQQIVFAVPKVRTANIYELGKSDGVPLYTQKAIYTELESGETQSKLTISDSQGNVVLNETSVYRGSQLISQEYDQLQTKKHHEVKVEEGWMYFRTWLLEPTKKDVPQKGTEKVTPEFITAPVSENFLIEKLPQLMAGEKVYCKFGVLEMQETYGFKFWLVEKSKFKGKDVVIIGMKPTNIFIALLVKDILLTIDPVEKKMVRFQGPTPLWKVDGNKFKSLNGEIYMDEPLVVKRN